MKEVITIEAIGNLLLHYRFDLECVKAFQDCKSYRDERLASFRDQTVPLFLKEYRVVRAIKKGKQKDFLDAVIDHVNSDGTQADDVDALAMRLEEQNITQEGKTMVSLASKILFLNRPWKILPYDRLVRDAVGYSGTIYADYLNGVMKRRKSILKLYDTLPKSVMTYLQVIEDKTRMDKRHVDKIRKMRFVDKMLWTIGKNKRDLACIE